MKNRKFEIYISIITTIFFISFIYLGYLEVKKESIHYDMLQEKTKIIKHTYGRDFNSYNEFLVYKIEEAE